MIDITYTNRIPDLTERYPEGFGGVDMCSRGLYDDYERMYELDQMELNMPYEDEDEGEDNNEETI